MILVTGASGYVGGAISAALAQEEVMRLVRRPVRTNDIAWDFSTSVQEILQKIAGKKVTHVIHVAWDMRSSRLDDLQTTAVAGSLRLLEASIKMNAKFIFISTISAFVGARSAYGRAKLQVEEAVLRSGGIVMRLGLVAGEGGMLGSLRQTIKKSRFIPMVGSGASPQYLLPEADMLKAVKAAISGRLDEARKPITLAKPVPVPFKTLLRLLAQEEGRSATFVPVPWQLLYVAFWTAECLRIKTGFRSDSVLSFVYQNQSPDFKPQEQFGLTPH